MAGRKLNKKKQFFGFARGRFHGIFLARCLPSRCCVVLVFLYSLAAAQLPNDIIICEIERCIKEDLFKVASIQKKLYLSDFSCREMAKVRNLKAISAGDPEAKTTAVSSAPPSVLRSRRRRRRCCRKRPS
nr:hypothetical protein Iba_chr05cCG3900 [Ipomoea batatas]